MALNGDCINISPPRPLKVLIAGAGIGGLTAAIALRKHGHEVQLFEQSTISAETGAALHITPNAWGLLERLDLDMRNIGTNAFEGFTIYSPKFEQISNLEWSGPSAQMWKHPWELAHRQKLHTVLRAKAMSSDWQGIPAKLFTSHRGVDVDCDNAILTLENGNVVSGDLVVAADGVRSMLRKPISGSDAQSFDSGQSAFRFMVPREQLLRDPKIAFLPALRQNGRQSVWVGSDRRVVMYPCQNNEVMNFACMHPSSESEAKSGDWQQGGSKERLLELYRDFAPEVKMILSHAPVESLKVWTLLDLEKLPTWWHGKAVLMGDAAHPFLPHQGQGASQAIEDAVALAALLPAKTPTSSIPERLKLFESCRYERAHKIQEYTRQAGKGHLNVFEYLNYNFGHDAWDHAKQQLLRLERQKLPPVYWRNPISFGPAPGPRQDVLGHRPNISSASSQTWSIIFKTSRTYLESFLPTGSFRFASPGTTAYASWIVSEYSNLEWLGGQGYRTFGLYVHGVQYHKRDDSKIDGTFLPVLFENLADPIITGREELGFPKLFCDIDVTKKTNGTQISFRWRDTEFGVMTLDISPDIRDAEHPQENNDKHSVLDHHNTSPQPPPSQPQEAPAEKSTLTYRYIPAVGKPGEADAEYAVHDPGPSPSQKPKVTQTTPAQSAKISFNAGKWTSLPTLHHIVDGFANVPVYGVVEAKVVEMQGVYDLSNCRRVE